MGRKYEFKMTVFTPTYNRAYILDKLYESLKRQNIGRFEWLIIDDGSTDNTQELVEKWQKEQNPFVINYYKKVNGGKHTAINYALEKLKGELLVIIDSDDFFVDGALETILSWDRDYKDKEKLAGFIFRRCNSRGIPNGDFDGDVVRTYMHNRWEYNITGEHCEVLYSDIICNYRFPVFEGEQYMIESVLWNQLTNDEYEFLFVNDALIVCEYLSDGLTNQGLQASGQANPEIFWRSPKGYAYWQLQESKIRHDNVFSRMKIYLNYYCELKDRISKKEIIENLNTNAFCINLLILAYKIKHLFIK